MTARNTVTWSVLGAFVGMLTSAVGGSWYVSSAIAERGRIARVEAKEMITEKQAQDAELYARREDVLVLKAKLDALLQMQREILRRLDRN